MSWSKTNIWSSDNDMYPMASLIIFKPFLYPCYLLLKNMPTLFIKWCFCIPTSWDFHSVPIDSKKNPYLWYAWFKSMSNFPLQSLVKHRQFSLTHIQPCGNYYSMTSLTYSEINAFLFSKCIFLFTQWNK